MRTARGGASAVPSVAFFVVWLLLTRQGMKIGSGITSADEHCVRLRIDRGRGELTWWEARGRGAKKESVPLESIESIEVVPAQYSGARRVVSILLFTDNEKAEAHDAIMEFDFLDDERAVELATSIAQILGWGPPVILPFEKDEDEAEPDSPEEETAAAGDDTDEDPVLGPRIRLSRTAQESPAAPPELDRRPFVTIPDGVQDPPWEKIDGIAVREDGLRIDERSRIWIGVGLVLSYFAVRSFMRILEPEPAGLIHEFVFALSASLIIWGGWTRLVERSPRMVIDRRTETVRMKGSHVQLDVPFSAIDRVVRITGGDRGVIFDTSEGSVRVPIDGDNLDDPMAARLAAGLSRWFGAKAESFSPPVDPDDEEDESREDDQDAGDKDAGDETG